MNAMDELLQLHRDVDEAAGDLARRHAARLRCGRGCDACCVDGISVFEIEAARIRRGNEALLATAAPHAEGACAFLDGEGACRIYEDRPYVCRTQGLPLRWFDRSEDGATVELRDICPLNDDPDLPLETLPADDCWTIGLYESRLAALQTDDPAAPRVLLRDLFAVAGDRLA